MNISPTENEIQYIRESLNKFNNAKVGDDGHTPLNIVEYDEDGDVIGGILGGTYWHCPPTHSLGSSHPC